MVAGFGVVGAPMSTALIYFTITFIPVCFVMRRVLRNIRDAHPVLAVTPPAAQGQQA